MGCCIPKRKCISVITSNKKSTPIKKANCEKSDKINLNKSISYLILEKYYLPFTVQEQSVKLNSSSNTDFFFTFQNPIDNTNINNKINTKKVKESMRKLKDFSLTEVNNCVKYFS